jgi:hypothetical protein
MTPKVSLFCTQCDYKAKRALVNEPGSRGVHEAPCNPAYCINGHGLMKRTDGGRVVKSKNK